MSTSKRVTDAIVETAEEFGVKLPDGDVALAEDEYDAKGVVEAAKTFDPKAKFKAKVRTVYYGEWRDAK